MTRTEITSLFGEAKLVLDETPKAISPFGGLASFSSFLGQLGFAQEVQRRRPFAEPASHNAIPLAHARTSLRFQRTPKSLGLHRASSYRPPR